MHDFVTLVQVLAAIATGLITLWLNNKKGNREYLKDENGRLNERVIRLTDRCDVLEKENSELRRKLENKNDN